MLLVAYILAMTFTLTYGGEHYVVDAFLGWLYAAAAVFGVAWLFRRRQVRPTADDAEVAQTVATGS
jgi:membrane-associated phospholipid phosphatase